MNQKNSFFLAVLLIANPVVLLFFQNCSMMPPTQASVGNRTTMAPSVPGVKNVSEQTRTPARSIYEKSF